VKPNLLGNLALQFTLLSLLAIGGANSTLSEMHRQFVEVAGYLTDRQFTELVAIANAAPGPNVVSVTVIGYQIAGTAGALVATLFMTVPAALFAFIVYRMFDRFKRSRWRMAIQAGLVPVSIGLIASTAVILTRAADHGWTAFAVTAVAFAITYWTRVSPLLPLAVGATLGLAGFL
jgi:chromate transporter